MECKSIDFQGEYGVLGEIVRLSVDEEYISKNGHVDVEKLNIIAFDPFNGDYYEVGKKIAKAYNAGRKYIK